MKLTRQLLGLIDRYFFLPMLALRRYFVAVHEIDKLSKLDTTLGERHLKHTVVLTNRLELLKRLPRGKDCAEVGVATGDFSQQILDICHPRQLRLIDYWVADRRAHGFNFKDLFLLRRGRQANAWDEVNAKFSAQLRSGVVVLQRGYSWDELDKLEDHSLDWIYLDAGHDYSSVAKDLELAREKVKPDGVIAGHDYVRWGKFGYRCGVVEAVNKFCLDHDYEMIYITMESRTNASFAIRKINQP